MRMKYLHEPMLVYFWAWKRDAIMLHHLSDSTFGCRRNPPPFTDDSLFIMHLRRRGSRLSVIISHAWLEGGCIIRSGKSDGWGSRVVGCWAVWPHWPCYHYGWQGWPVQPLLQQAAVAFNGIICSSPCHPLYLSLSNSLSVFSSLWYLVSWSRAVEIMPNLTGSLIKVRTQVVI